MCSCGQYLKRWTQQFRDQFPVARDKTIGNTAVTIFCSHHFKYGACTVAQDVSAGSMEISTLLADHVANQRAHTVEEKRLTCRMPLMQQVNRQMKQHLHAWVSFNNIFIFSFNSSHTNCFDSEPILRLRFIFFIIIFFIAGLIFNPVPPRVVKT